MQNNITERMTAHIEGDFVVFLIGMRINKLRKIHQWLPVARAMPRMLRELQSRPELGLLGHRFWQGGRNVLVVQYWRSTEQLMRYAHDREAEHLPAWRDFNRRVGTSDSVGIWHETFQVAEGKHESIYLNMPRFGLGQAGELVEARGRRRTAAGRLGHKQSPEQSAEHELAA
jgi:Domain of unknown function (DUF4188)